MWLTQMRHKDSYTYAHSVDNCALAIAFGRHMGLYKDDLNTLAMGLLLMDIGKMRVPIDVLNKTEPLTEDDLAGDIHWQRGLRCHDCHGGDPSTGSDSVAP